jgi:hypothetical protein
MRWFAIAVLAACRVPYEPSASLAINHFTQGEVPEAASVGSRVELTTSWSDTCERRSAPILAGSYEGAGKQSYTCNEVRHRVRVHCVEHCRIRAPNSETADDELAFGPTREPTTFVIQPRASTLRLEVTFEHDGDRRVRRVGPMRFVTPADLVVECGIRGAWGSCDPIGIDPNASLRVRDPSGVSLGPVQINGTIAPYGLVPITHVVSLQGEQLVPGDYPIVVEVGAFRREVAVRVR